MLIWNDDLETALAHADGLLAACRPQGWATAVANCQWIRAMAAVRAGRVAEAADDARPAYDFILRDVASAFDGLGGPAAGRRADRGVPSLDAAEAVFARVDPDTLEPGLLVRPTLFESRSRLRLAQQRPREALADARAAAADWAELQCDGAGIALWRVCAVEALMALDERDEARALAAEQLALAERHGALTSLAAALRAVAHAAAPGDAIAALERAAALFAAPAASNGAAAGLGRLEHLRALVDLGAALRRRGRLRRRSGAAARGAPSRRSATVPCGWPSGRGRSFSRRVRGRERALAGRDALTPAERRIARLAAGGRTNRQIAQELLVTQRTVETHLTHTFAKLDIGVAG